MSLSCSLPLSARRRRLRSAWPPPPPPWRSSSPFLLSLRGKRIEFLNGVRLSHFQFAVSGVEAGTCEVVSVHSMEEQQAHEGHEAQAGHHQPDHQEAVAALRLHNLWGAR